MRKVLIQILIVLLNTFTFAQDEMEYELTSIAFVGNSYFSNAELGDVISLRESPSSISQFFNDLIGLGEDAIFFDSLSLSQEELRLQSYYFNNGFFAARVSSTYFLDDEDFECNLVFEIIEGNVNNLSKIEIYGLNNIESEFFGDIKSLAEIDTTEQYSYSKVSAINSNITSYLRNNGYMFASSDSTIIFIDSVKLNAEGKLFFTHGQSYSLSDIQIEKTGIGKEEVKTELIKEIASLEEGATYDESEIRKAQSRLYKTNLFNIAYVRSVIEDTSGSYVPIKIETDIGSMYELSPELIMNNEDNRFNLGLSLGFSKKNFLGNARILTLNGSIASQNIFEFISNMAISDTSVIGYADLRLIVEQPFLFGNNINTRAELYSTLQKRKNEYNTTANGLKLRLDFEVPDFVYINSFNTTWNFENLKVLYQESYLETLFRRYINDAPGYTPEEKDSLATEIASEIGKESTTNNTLLAFNFGANKTNDFTFPSRGYKTNLLIGNANALPFILSKVSGRELNTPLYYKTQIDFSAFPPLYYSRENAFGFKLRVGLIHVYDGLESSVPYNQRFTSGGSNSVRGWQSRELVPEFSLGEFDYTSISPADLEAILLDQAAPGGLFLFEGSIETRNRIIGEIGGAIFLDYGNSWANTTSFRFDEIAVSTGFGIRYYTDFIPFRLDFGIKLYDPRTKTTINHMGFWNEVLQIHFAIGEAF